MKSMRLVSEGQPLQLSTLELPKVEAGSVLVKVELAGVCHTDLHLIEGSYDLGEGRKLPTGIHLPVTLGHEICGTVEEVASDVRQASSSTTEITRGDRVVIYPWIGCGACRKCQMGLENLCEGSLKFIGVFLDGGYSDYVLIPNVRYLVRVEGINPKQAAPLACSGLTAFSSVKKCDLNSGDLLLIIGAGESGHLLSKLPRRSPEDELPCWISTKVNSTLPLNWEQTMYTTLQNCRKKKLLQN
jgi:alcohol dehydrogenase, propanol-preferring